MGVAGFGNQRAAADQRAGSASAQALFAMTLAVTVAGQDYLIESVASNEAFGQVYCISPLVARSLRAIAVNGEFASALLVDC